MASWEDFAGELLALQALASGPGESTNTTFALGGPDTVTLDQFLRTALGAMGRRRPILHIPKSLGRLQGALLQSLPRRPLTPDAVDFVSQGGALTAADRRLLGERFPEFTATPLSAALADYLKG